MLVRLEESWIALWIIWKDWKSIQESKLSREYWWKFWSSEDSCCHMIFNNATVYILCKNSTSEIK